MITGVFCLTARSWKKRRETRRPGQIVFFLSFLQVVGRGADRRGWGCRSSLGCLRVVRPSLCQFLFRSSRCSGGSLGRWWRASLCLCLTVCRSSARVVVRSSSVVPGVVLAAVVRVLSVLLFFVLTWPASRRPGFCHYSRVLQVVTAFHCVFRN